MKLSNCNSHIYLAAENKEKERENLNSIDYGMLQ